MKKIARTLVCLALISFTGISFATIDFSPSNSPSSGHWYYEGDSATSGTFSFVQEIVVDHVNGTTTDGLCGMYVYISDLELENYISMSPGVMGQGSIASGGTIQIKDSLGTVILGGALNSGGEFSIGTNGAMYWDINYTDLDVTELATGYSDYVDSLNLNSQFDVILSLSISGVAFDSMITAGDGSTGSGNMSGQLTVPEPATMALLSLGGLLIRRKR